MLYHPFERENYYQNKAIFNGLCSINKLPKIKKRGYGINLDEYKSMGSHWKA